MSDTFEHEATASFELKGKSVHVHLWTLLSSSEELGGITIRDHKGRVLARVTEDGFGDRDPKKIRVTVDLSEAFTQKLPRGTSYHHSAEIFDALGPLIAALPKSKWEKTSKYKSPAQLEAEKVARRRKRQRKNWGLPERQPPGGWLGLIDRFPFGHPARKEILAWHREEPPRRSPPVTEDVPREEPPSFTTHEGVGVPRKTPPGGWRLFYELLSALLPQGHPALQEASKRWSRQDPYGYKAWIADTMPPFSEWLGWRREFLVDTATHEATLGLSRDYGAPEIQRAFRLKTKTAHPDVGGSAEEFRRITEARDVLLRAVGMH